MLTRDFRRPEERTRHPLKPLFSHFFLPTPTTIARLDIRLRRAALYPAELRVLRACLQDERNIPPDAGRVQGLDVAGVWLIEKKMGHVRRAPYLQQTQGKSERLQCRKYVA